MSTEWYHIWCDGNGGAAIYIYGDIPPDSEYFFAELNSIPAPNTVDVYVNSMGGDLYSAMAIHDRLKGFADNGCVIRAHVEGVAASGAALILAAADQVFVQPDANVMIHSPRYCNGQEPDERLAVMCAGMARRLASKTRHGKDAVMELLSAGKWLTASEAVSAGLADVAVSDEGVSG